MYAARGDVLVCDARLWQADAPAGAEGKDRRFIAGKWHDRVPSAWTGSGGRMPFCGF